MIIPPFAFESLQTILDGPWPRGLAREQEPGAQVLYQADIDSVLVPGLDLPLTGPAKPCRGWTEWELENLKQSLPVLGFPRHRLVTHGPSEGRIYSLKTKRTLKPINRYQHNSGEIRAVVNCFLIYHSAVRTGVWLSSKDVLAGRWPAGLQEVGCRVPSPEEIKLELDRIAGGSGRWQPLDPIGFPGYVMTDQSRVFRVAPQTSGRAQSSRTGETIPYEIRPYRISSNERFWQYGFPEVDLDGLPIGNTRLYVRPLYAMVWGVGNTPLKAAAAYLTNPHHPFLDLRVVFEERRRGRPRSTPLEATDDSTGNSNPDPGIRLPEEWDEETSVSV
jgi:hypothetical protein